MPTDLTTVRDHPAVLLEEDFPSAAKTLRVVEQYRGVTFAALDNDALTAVREAFATWEQGGSVEDRGHSANHLVYAVADLLGLGDQ